MPQPLSEPDRQLFAALGRVPSGVFILTVKNGAHETGMLASWVQQCSFMPPRISVAVQPTREVVKLLDGDARLVLNILEASQTDMIAHFGKGFPLGADAFIDLEVTRNVGGPPILAEALAYLEGKVAERFPAGDHDLYVIEISAGMVQDEGGPMIHIRKNGTHY